MKTLLITLLLFFFIIYILRFFFWKKIYDNILKQDDKNKLINNLKEVFLMRTFSRNIILKTKGFIWRNAYNKLTFLNWVIMFIIVCIVVFGNYFVLS